MYTNIRLWSNSDVYSSKDNYFNNKEYLLGCSAFSAIPQDWLVDNNLELDEEDELDQPSDEGERHSQICAYLLEVR